MTCSHPKHRYPNGRHRWERYRHAMSSAGWYLRRNLHRRIFFLLGASILVTALVMMALSYFATPDANWHREAARVRSFVAGEFALVWKDPSARDALAKRMADELDLDLTLKNADSHTVQAFGPAACKHPAATVPIAAGAETIGFVDVCFDRARGTRPFQFVGALFVLWVMLWGASGALARRLTRPYSELARVAREIGAGKLSSRFQLPWRRGMDEARVLADAINDMATRIERQMGDQRELLAAVSHEIRTPLSRIRLVAELLRGELGAGKSAVAAKALDELDREVIEIDALVSELLASSRLDFAALRVHPLDPADVATRALDRAGLPASLLQLDVTATKFEADATLVARALANLLANANAHAGGVDALRVREADGRIVFEVLDHGPGFAPGEEAKAFESFYQRPGAEAREKGSLGLGLTLVKRIAVAHGGTAFAVNRERGGASVGIRLPRAAVAP